MSPHLALHCSTAVMLPSWPEPQAQPCPSQQYVGEVLIPFHWFENQLLPASVKALPAGAGAELVILACDCLVTCRKQKESPGKELEQNLADTGLVGRELFRPRFSPQKDFVCLS